MDVHADYLGIIRKACMENSCVNIDSWIGIQRMKNKVMSFLQSFVNFSFDFVSLVSETSCPAGAHKTLVFSSSMCC